MEKSELAIVGGAGHVGLPLALSFADKGRRVLIQDINQRALDVIKSGTMPFMDRGAEQILQNALSKDLLSFSTDCADLSEVPVIIITIGTPIDSFLNPLLRDIQQCIDAILPYLSDEQTIILRSTVYPGVTDWLDRYLRGKGKRTRVAFCPERVVQGFAIEELRSFPQIISGTTPEAADTAAKLFSVCVPDVVRMRPMEAEFAKLFSNVYRYIQFATANQFYMLADSAGLDYYTILEGMKKNYPRCRDIPGAGFAAGPCLFKDTMQLAAFSGNKFNLGHEAMLVNEGLPFHIIGKLDKQYDLPNTVVGLLGMAFKSDSDDPRSSLSYKLKNQLSFRASKVLTTDPFVKGDLDIMPLDDVLQKSDVLVICAPHTDYKKLDFGSKPVIDIWNCLETRKADAVMRV